MAAGRMAAGRAASPQRADVTSPAWPVGLTLLIRRRSSPAHLLLVSHLLIRLLSPIADGDPGPTTRPARRVARWSRRRAKPAVLQPHCDCTATVTGEQPGGPR